eukprot:comp12232_c0_seq1/m.15854 comp12232_c0_seq1/g.15854  ORF comp12232_c0_seq1/g.15854 comp12232_c0_seq1/m.15854 type:complete len:119 (+) comp12232_c0_seq1:11-367(+)
MATSPSVQREIVVLFRDILRTHRAKLPGTLRSVGDKYVKQEFRLHWKAKPNHVERFLREWRGYLDQFSARNVPAADLDPNVVATMTPDQQKQLQRLKESVISRAARENSGNSSGGNQS